jgi:hypothetical protein
LEDLRSELRLPEEPSELRAQTRRLIEESPCEGRSVIRDGEFLAAPLWEEWSDALSECGMDYDAFVEVTRGYADEVRLWVVGERVWEHCASGLAGRASRRVPEGCGERAELAGSGARR